MKVSEVMTESVIMISADSPVREAAEEMKRNGVGAIPVHEGGVLQGMVTDRDLVVRVMAEGRDAQETTAGDVMSPRLVTCFGDQDIGDVVRLMREKQIRRVVVLDRQERPSGIVSLGDIAAHESVQVAAETLKSVSDPVRSV